MQIQVIHPSPQADEAHVHQNTRLAQQIAGAAPPGQLEALYSSQLSSVLPMRSTTLTHTGKSAYSTSQARVKSFKNRHVNHLELVKVSQRSLAGIIRNEAFLLSSGVIKWWHLDLELHLTITIINEEESAKGT